MTSADPELARREGHTGYYVLDLDREVALRGPYGHWRDAVREATEINGRRLHERPVEVRLVGTPAPAP